MKNIPYGLSSFETVKTENYYYIDKTKYIEILENYGSRYLFFLRPRRFGKSLFVSMLHHYYDINAKAQFDTLFGDTYIGKNPTPRRNTYPVLSFDFSMVQSYGTIDEIRESFIKYVHSEIKHFVKKYNDLFKISEAEQQHFFSDNYLSLDVVRDVFIRLRETNYHTFLIIDEYDNFANNILIEHGSETYTSVTHSGGFLRNFFTNLKGLTDNREIDRLFITGVSPLVMADVTSGFNIGDNISQDPQLSSMIGITQSEAKAMLDYYNSFGVFDKPLDFILDDWQKWYNGYSFNQNLEKIYNTVSVLYYVHQYIETKRVPISLVDENMRTDYGKFRFLLTQNNTLNGNFSILKEVAEYGETSGVFVRSFAQNELIVSEKFKSFLFYLGFTSIKEVSIFGKYTYTIPNNLIKMLLWEFIQKSLTEVYQLKINTMFLSNAFDRMARDGAWQPVLQYIIDRFYEAVSIRDFVFHEEGIKTFILAWLNMTAYYKVYSERELKQGFADIYIEPEAHFASAIKYGFIIELKYIKSEFLRTKKKSEPEIAQAIEKATAQLQQYAAYNNCTTVKIIVVASAKKLLYMNELKIN